MKLYYKEYDYPYFVLNITEVDSRYASFELEEVESWGGELDDLETSLYLKGSIKWDGCSRLEIGDNGYLHLCGVELWKRHCRVMEWVYKEVSKLIKDFEEDEVWND